MRDFSERAEGGTPKRLLGLLAPAAHKLMSGQAVRRPDRGVGRRHPDARRFRRGGREDHADLRKSLCQLASVRSPGGRSHVLAIGAGGLELRAFRQIPLRLFNA
jgi:hypothetical protein